ncbi:MAG: hypothetical protein QM724_00345 [Flavobacteriales bacterium]
MRYQHRLCWLALPVVLLAACKKERTNGPLRITIVSPGGGSTLVVPDTLTATLQVSDDARVEHVSIQLVDANGVPITPGATATPAGTTVILRIPVRSERIRSGDYALVATASGGGTDAHDFRTVHVVAVPPRLRAVFAFTSVGSTTGLSRIDSAGSVSALTSWNMDATGAAASSYDQMLYVCGGVTGDLLALDANDRSVQWSKPNLSLPGAPYFSALGFGGDIRPYVATSDGFLRGYNASTGLGEFTAALPSGFRGDRVLVVGERVFCSMHHIATQEQRLRTYQRSSGAPIGDQLLTQVPVGLFKRSTDALLLFGNTAGHSVVEERNVELGGAWQPRAWSQPIAAVEQVDGDTWILALADGTIERFTYANTSSQPIAQIADVQALAYDPLNGLLYIGAGTQVLAIDPLTGQIGATYTIGGEVRYVVPLFNR